MGHNLIPLSSVCYDTNGIHADFDAELVNSLSVLPVHERVMQHFNRFALVGGMPAAIVQYAENKDILSVAPVYHALIESYKDDAEKYAPNDTATKAKRHILISYFDTSNNLRKALLRLFPSSDKYKLIPPDFNKLSNFVLFVHPETGLRIFPEIAAYVSDTRNPFYSIDAVEQKGIEMLTGYYELPNELLEYLIDRQFLKDISLNSLHGKEYGNKQLQENIRFIVRFFQPFLYNQKEFVS